MLSPMARDVQSALTSRDLGRVIKSGQSCARYLLGRIWQAAAQKGGHGIPASHDENHVASLRLVKRLDCRADQSPYDPDGVLPHLVSTAMLPHDSIADAWQAS